MQKPALSLAAVPGRRHKTIELAKDIERRGFSGIYCPSFGAGMGLCQALARCWLADTTLFGSATKVREGIEAFEEFFALYD